MKLNKLIIKNFRGLKGNKNIICFDGLNIIFLIGQNNVGKSTFLQAYQFFVNSKQTAVDTDFHNYDKNEGNPIKIEMEAWFTKEIDDDDDADLSDRGKIKEPDWINKWVDSQDIIKVKKVWNVVGAGFEKYTWDPKEDGSWVSNGFGGFHTKLQKYAPTPIFINAIGTPEVLEKNVNELINKFFLKGIEENIKYQKIKESILALQREILGLDKLKDINSVMNEVFEKVFPTLSLQIKAKNDDDLNIVKAFEKNHSIGVQKDGVEREANFTQYGHGVIRQALFNFVKAIGPFINGSDRFLILFEEPEIFLHPKAISNLRGTLYELAEKPQFQILCATHSPAMIDIAKLHTSLIRLVKNTDETTQSFQVDDNIFRTDSVKKQFVQMINRFNPHICEAFYADKVLLVEGDSEAIVYRELLNKFFLNEDIFVLNTGSKNNIPFFQKILTHFMIEHYIIHDADEEKCKDGRINSAWALNETIWQNVVEANSKALGFARRYVHVKDFESANGYSFTSNKGKPLSAYEFVQKIDKEQDIPCLNWLRDIIGERKILHDQDYLLAAMKP